MGAFPYRGPKTGHRNSKENIDKRKNGQIVSAGTTEVVVVGLDQVQEPVLIDIGLDVISVESMIILWKTVQPQN